MEILYHTAGITDPAGIFKQDIPIELDFVFPRDGEEAYWSHNLSLMLHSSKYLRGRGYLTLGEILKKNERYGRKLMLDMKFVPWRVIRSSFFEKLNEYASNHGEIRIATLDPRLLDYLIKNREELKHLKPGLIVNVISRWFIFLPPCARVVAKLDFLSISSELWQRRKGRYVKKVVEHFPHTKRYAWVWAIPTREETDKLIRLFLEMGADGILTENPEATSKIINNHPANT